MRTAYSTPSVLPIHTNDTTDSHNDTGSTQLDTALRAAPPAGGTDGLTVSFSASEKRWLANHVTQLLIVPIGGTPKMFIDMWLINKRMYITRRIMIVGETMVGKETSLKVLN